jgi:membrane protease YdiL (CAAX protease family)
MAEQQPPSEEKRHRTIAWNMVAGLFMLGHIYYINQHPVSFWLIIPLGALVLGGLACRSKTISSSLAAHAIMNTLGYPLANFLALLRV